MNPFFGKKQSVLIFIYLAVELSIYLSSIYSQRCFVNIRKNTCVIKRYDWKGRNTRASYILLYNFYLMAFGNLTFLVLLLFFLSNKIFFECHDWFGKKKSVAKYGN